MVTICPSAAVPSSPIASVGAPVSPSGEAAGSGSVSGLGPCPGQGYTCDDCLDGWFCPPAQTPAISAPCGTGWPCYHCNNGWFCVPSPRTVRVVMPYAVPTPSTVIQNVYPARNSYHHVGCYQATPENALRNVQPMNLASGMTIDRCINTCQSQSFGVAATKGGTQCFCGKDLMESFAMSNEPCNMGNMDSTMNLSICGGSESLCVWSFDGNDSADSSHQQRSTGFPFPSAVTSARPRISSIEHAKAQITPSTFAWPPAASSAKYVSTLADKDLPGVEMVILSMVLSEAREKQGTLAQDFLGSISSLLNMKISSSAQGAPIANLTGSTISPTDSSSILLSLGGVAPITIAPSSATLYVTAMAGGSSAASTSSALTLAAYIDASDAIVIEKGDQASLFMDGTRTDDAMSASSTFRRDQRASRRRVNRA